MKRCVYSLAKKKSVLSCLGTLLSAACHEHQNCSHFFGYINDKTQKRPKKNSTNKGISEQLLAENFAYLGVVNNQSFQETWQVEDTWRRGLKNLSKTDEQHPNGGGPSDDPSTLRWSFNFNYFNLRDEIILCLHIKASLAKKQL